MESKNKLRSRLENDLKNANDLLYYYEQMKEKALGESHFIFVVDKVKAMGQDGAQLVLVNHRDAAVFNGELMEKLNKNLVFQDKDGKKFEPVGPVLASDFFDSKAEEIRELVSQIIEFINTLKNEQQQ